MMAALALCCAANSQEVMKIELKDGRVRTYYVEDINRFYFEGGQQEELADDCEIEIEDEVVLTTCAAFELSYDYDVASAYAGYFTESEIHKYSEEQIVTMLKNGGGILLNKTQTEVNLPNLQEGNKYVFIYVGFNAQGKRGQLYMHPFTTSVLADLQAKKGIAEVKSVKYDDDYFYFTVEADEVLVGEYYLSTKVGNNLTPYGQSLALLGLRWKDAMDEDEEKAGQNYFGKDFRSARPNGENSLQILIWSTDANFDLVGYIFEDMWHTNATSREQAPSKADGEQHIIKAYSKQELKDMLGSSMKFYRVRK